MTKSSARSLIWHIACVIVLHVHRFWYMKTCSIEIWAEHSDWSIQISHFIQLPVQKNYYNQHLILAQKIFCIYYACNGVALVFCSKCVSVLYVFEVLSHIRRFLYPNCIGLMSQMILTLMEVQQSIWFHETWMMELLGSEEYLVNWCLILTDQQSNWVAAVYTTLQNDAYFLTTYSLKSFFRSTLLSRPNKVSRKCLSVHTYVRPSTKRSFSFSDIWYVGRGRWVIQDGMQYDPIQGQGHEPLKGGNSSIFKSCLRHLQWELATDHGFLN